MSRQVTDDLWGAESCGAQVGDEAVDTRGSCKGIGAGKGGQSLTVGMQAQLRVLETYVPGWCELGNVTEQLKASTSSSLNGGGITCFFG